MSSGNKIVKKVDIEEFLGIIKNYSEDQIECTNHAFFRLNDSQRLIYTPEKLKDYLLNNEPFLVGLQKNGNHAMFYKYHKKKFMRMIIDLKDIRKINIVTFYFIESKQIPII